MIVITAPTGQIGRHVVTDLLAMNASLRLVLRDASKLGDDVRDRVETVEGSHGDPHVIDHALAGADALFWLAPPDATLTLEQAYLDFTRPAVEAIQRREVARVVSITALGRGTDWQEKAGLVSASIRMDDMLMASGAAFRGLAMPSFMDNVLRQASTIKELGTMFGTIDPDKKDPTTATRDMGAVAAEVLADASWTGNEIVPVLGPEDLSPNDMAAIISDVIGSEVRYQQISLDAFKEQLLGNGMTPSFAEGYVEMMRAKDEGMDNVARLSGRRRTPTTFRHWCVEALKPPIVGT